MIFYSFISTFYFILTFSIKFIVVLDTTILRLIKYSFKYFFLFVLAYCLLSLLPLFVLIEFLLYIAEKISLRLILIANILSNHMLLNILSGFTYNI